MSNALYASDMCKLSYVKLCISRLCKKRHHFVCVRMHNAAYILLIMLSSISGLDN